MAHHAMYSLFFLLFLVLSLSPPELVAGAPHGNNVLPASTAIPLTGVRTVSQRLFFLHKDGMPKKSRKLEEADDGLVQLDYDDAGPNPKHDPRRGRGGRNR